MAGKLVPPEIRFWRFVEQTPTCWLWRGAIVGRGYGQFGTGGTGRAAAHRFAYELLVGPIPAGLTIDHLCRVKRCVNPAHLEPVTNAENIRRREPYRKTGPCKQGHITTLDGHGHRRCRLCERPYQIARNERRRRERAERRAA